MNRVPAITRQDLSAAGQEVWDVIEKTRGGVFGPYAVLMTVPQIAQKVAAVGEQLRFYGVLNDYERELVIIATAVEAGSSFELAIHEPLATRAGISIETVNAVLGRDSEDVLAPRDRLIVEIVRSLFRQRRLTDNLFERALNEFGYEALTELVTIIGFYDMLAFIMLAFEVTEADRPFYNEQ